MMKKIYSAPTVEITVFDTNTIITKSGNFGSKRPDDVGSSKYKDVFDF